MSTVLVDTEGGSKFRASDDLISDKAGFATALFSLFGLEKSIQLANTDGNPKLRPQRKVIDVVNDFSWYAGPKATSHALDKVPTVFLTEKEQQLSSLISGAMYYLNAAKTFGEQLANAEYLKSALARLQTVDGNGALNKYNKYFDQIGKQLQANSNDFSVLARHNLKSLQGIYLTEETDFLYRLPMYDLNKITRQYILFR